MHVSRQRFLLEPLRILQERNGSGDSSPGPSGLSCNEDSSSRLRGQTYHIAALRVYSAAASLPYEGVERRA